MNSNNDPSTDHAAGRSDPERESASISDEAVRRLAEAVARLSNDPDWFLQALTEAVLAMTPISMVKRTKQQDSFLVESGTFTAEELAEAQMYVDRGALQLSSAGVFLSNLLRTMSFHEATGYLDLDEEAVRTAVAEGRLYAIKISGQLRFPAWQFNVGSPEKLIPRLTELIEVVSSRWDWQSTAAFLATPQSSLVAEGRKTPIDWLRDGGDIQLIRNIVESNGWS